MNSADISEYSANHVTDMYVFMYIAQDNILTWVIHQPQLEIFVII